MKGERIAVYGMGRSGVSAAKALVQAGAEPVVFDDAPAEKLREALAQLEQHQIASEPGYRGSFNGFTTLVTSPGVPMRHPRLIAAGEAGVEVIGEVELAYRLSAAPIIGITGTNGKSTTTVMTYLCLLAAAEEAVLCGNVFGSGYDEVPLTEAASAATPEQVLVAEISSFQLEWVRDFRPVCAAITNITPDHLNRYRDFDEYAAIKHRIFAAQLPGDTAVIKANDPAITAPAGPTVKTFGSSGEHAFVVGNDLIIGDHSVPVSQLPFAGVHNYLNAMAAGLLAASFLRGAKEDLTYILDGLQSFKGLEHRMEYVGEAEGVTFINNSMCTNPDAVLKSCMSIGQRMHILMGGENKDLDFSPIRPLFDGTRNRGYAFGSAAKLMAETLGLAVEPCETLQQAFDCAMRFVERGDVVILAPGCASTDQFRDFRHRGDVFRALAKEWIQG